MPDNEVCERCGGVRDLSRYYPSESDMDCHQCYQPEDQSSEDYIEELKNQALQTKLDLAGEINKSLETQLSDKAKVCNAQHEFIKRLEAENAALEQRTAQLRTLLTKMGLDLWSFASMVSRTKKSDAWGNCVDEANKILKTEKKA